ncbi:MAG: hypothetical protein WCS56_01525 [Bacilli bacterium]
MSEQKKSRLLVALTVGVLFSIFSTYFFIENTDYMYVGWIFLAVGQILVIVSILSFLTMNK